MTRLAIMLISLPFLGQPDLQEDQGKKKPAAAPGARVLLPEAFAPFSMDDAEEGDQGWTDGVVRNRKRELWIKKGAMLERYQTAKAQYFVSLGADGWVLWITPGMQMRSTPDSELAGMNLVEITGLDFRLLGKK